MKTITNVDKVNNYTSPVVKEIELSTEGLICTSPGGGEGYNPGTGEIDE